MPRCLQDLRQVHDWIAARILQHALYNIRLAPCGWQHFLRARETFPADGMPVAGIRSGNTSAARHSLLNVELHEEEMMQAQAATMMQLDWVRSMRLEPWLHGCWTMLLYDRLLRL